MKNKANLTIVILTALVCLFLYLWVSKPSEVVDDTATSLELERYKIENKKLKIYIVDTLKKKEAYYDSLIKIKDSVILAKRINNWNLIQRHEKELEKYKSIPIDSAYIEWVRIARTE